MDVKVKIAENDSAQQIYTIKPGETSFSKKSNFLALYSAL